MKVPLPFFISMTTHNHYLLTLALTKGLGPVSVKNLIAYCGSVEGIFAASRGKLLRTPGIGEHLVAALQKRAGLDRAEKELTFCQKHNIEILSYLDKAYPNFLKYIHDAPLVLFKKGAVDLNAQPAIAIVGTRRATDYGKELSAAFADFFSQRGINVISGLAYGIDICAHKAVLGREGITTAVLAHGLDTIYPGRHSRSAARMLKRGALLTEYFTGTKPDAPHFPARNRIISGISRAVVVIEAGKSGGALITARYAFDQNREVYAIPGRVGDPFSQGCNALIRSNIAKLLVDPQDILDDLEIKWNQQEQKSEQLELFAEGHPHLSTEEMKVLNALVQGDLLLDQLTEHTGIGLSTLSALLLGLELKGMIRQLPGKKFRRLR